MLIWRCKKCGWIGRDSDLGLHYGNDELYKDSSKLQNGYGTISPTGNYISQEVSEPEPGEKDSGKITNFRT